MTDMIFHKAHDSIHINVTLQDIQSHRRLDHFLVQRLPDYGRTVLKRLFDNNLIIGSKEKLQLKKMPKEPTTITIFPPQRVDSGPVAENIPLDILYEDKYLLFVNKPPGMVTHPAPGHSTGTLMNAILHYCPDIREEDEGERPGIVHRLDKGTAGVMAVAKDRKTHARLAALFASHHVDREYECIVRGCPLPKQGYLQSTIGRHPRLRQKMAINVSKGRQASTYYEVLQSLGPFSLCRMKLETGRTHQIRVHAASLMKTPILNDSTYGHPFQDREKLPDKVASFLGDYEHPFLYAKKLGLIHPASGKKLLFKVPPPQCFKKCSWHFLLKFFKPVYSYYFFKI